MLSACVLTNKVECAINFFGIAQLSLNYVGSFNRWWKKMSHHRMMQYFAFRMLDPGSWQYYFTASSDSLLILKLGLGLDTNIRMFFKILERLGMFRKFHDIYKCRVCLFPCGTVFLSVSIFILSLLPSSSCKCINSDQYWATRIADLSDSPVDSLKEK